MQLIRITLWMRRCTRYKSQCDLVTMVWQYYLSIPDIRIYFFVNTMHKIQYGIGSEIWKIVFHFILEIFHSIPFWHLHIPYRNFCSISFYFPFHSIPCPQERREPNVGPGPAQIWRISGFVYSKTDGKTAAFLSELWCDLKKKVFPEILTVEIRWSPKKIKKKVFTEILTVFSVEIRWSPKKKKVFRPHLLISQCYFDGPLSSSWLKPTVFLKPMGPLKSMDPGVIVLLCPPSRWPCMPLW